MKRGKINIGYLLILSLLGIYVLVGILAPFLANDKAIACKQESGWTSPIIKGIKTEDCENRINAPIRYSYYNIDEKNANFVSPFGEQQLEAGQQRHYLGTDQLGRDLAAGMIHGFGVALLTGSLSMAIALIIGLLIGLTGGYFGNDQLRMSRKSLIQVLLGFCSLFYLLSYISIFINNPFSLLIYLLATVLLLLLLQIGFRYFPYFRKRIILPLDLLFS